MYVCLFVCLFIYLFIYIFQTSKEYASADDMWMNKMGDPGQG